MKVKERCSCGEVYPETFEVSNLDDMLNVLQMIDQKVAAWSLKHHQHGHIIDFDADTGKILSECL